MNIGDKIRTNKPEPYDDDESRPSILPAGSIGTVVDFVTHGDGTKSATVQFDETWLYYDTIDFERGDAEILPADAA